MRTLWSFNCWWTNEINTGLSDWVNEKSLKQKLKYLEKGPTKTKYIQSNEANH